MKKCFALLMAILMLMNAAAFAEEDGIEVVTDYVGTNYDVEDILDFGLAMDAIPEGYTLTSYDVDGELVAIFENMNDSDATVVFATVAHSESFDMYTLDAAALTEEQLDNLYTYLSDDLSDATFSFVKTAHGTDVILMQASQNDTMYYAEYVTIYEGYFITVAMLNTRGELTDADLALGLQLLSDMWILPIE